MVSRSRTLKNLVLLVAVTICLTTTTIFAQDSQLSRGIQWVRNNDFTIMAAVGQTTEYPQTKYVPELYRDLGTSNFLPWTFKPLDIFLQKNERVNLPWHELVYLEYTATNALTDSQKDLSQSYYNRFPGNTGFILMDEPNRLQMDAIRSAGDWYRQTFPDSIVYTNILPYGVTQESYYGTTPPPGGYDYGDYVNDAINVMKTDVLMYDRYPFLNTGETDDMYFANMEAIRVKALEAGIPYWAWMQSYYNTSTNYFRTPSGSDLRMEVYSHLTSGYTGISYFTYNDLRGPAIINNDNTTTQLYTEAQNINTRVANLGKVLKHLTSTDVRYVAGYCTETYYELWDILHTNPKTRIVRNSLPAGTTAWTQNAGNDNHIVDIVVFDLDEENNALIGFFTDDYGEEYFMLTNLKHGPDLSPEDCTLEFNIVFDATINELLTLNPDTGEEELLLLDNHILNLNLAGGTGMLFKYNTGAFVPEPTSLFLLGAAALCPACFRKRIG